jgi:hypothetical protein
MKAACTALHTDSSVRKQPAGLSMACPKTCQQGMGGKVHANRNLAPASFARALSRTRRQAPWQLRIETHDVAAKSLTHSSYSSMDTSTPPLPYFVG